MRINVVQKAQKAQGDCQSCDEPINVGDSYKWIKPRYGGKRVRHATCPTWRPSEMTSSDKLAQLYGATESLEDAVDEWDGQDLDGLRGDVETAADEIAEVAEGYRESAQNIEDGFQHPTAQSEELEGKADEVESFADEIRDVLDQFDDFDEDTVREEIQSDAETSADEVDVDETLTERRDEWAQEIRDAVMEAAGNSPL